LSTPAGEPTEEELRAAYEAELSRISSADMMLQTVVSLLNIGIRRIGLAGGPDAPSVSRDDLEQVRDAIDGASALLVVLERHHPEELRPMRDALSQLQIAYTRQSSATPSGGPASEQAQRVDTGSAAQDPNAAPAAPEEPRPGPAQSSGRLWVPGS
jgi:hypothetical protein